MTGINGNFSINEMFAKISSTIEAKGADLESAIANAGGEKGLSDSEMLKMQFLVNQYNTLLETASSVTKSLVDEAKQIAQRSN